MPDGNQRNRRGAETVPRGNLAHRHLACLYKGNNLGVALYQVHPAVHLFGAWARGSRSFLYLAAQTLARYILSGPTGERSQMWVRVAIAILLLLLPTALHAQAEKRIALLIGNKDYKAGVGALTNPLNDIRIVGEALKAVGFEVLKPVENAPGARGSALL